jgi:hypothetical protein
MLKYIKEVTQSFGSFSFSPLQRLNQTDGNSNVIPTVVVPEPCRDRGTVRKGKSILDHIILQSTKVVLAVIE